MKNKINIFPIVFSIICFSFIAGCGSDSDKTTTTASDPYFYEKMRDTTPVYEPVDSRSAKELLSGGDWSESNGLLHSVYYTLRGYQYPDDEGIVDRSNLYKLLFDAETVFTGAYTSAQELETPQNIASPFAGMDTSASTFTHAANIEDDSLCIAYAETDQKIEALVTWKWLDAEDENHVERGIAYYIYEKDSEDISIDMVFAVDYDISTTATDYNLRCKATGNVADHSFQFNYLIGNNQIVAKGVSQGEDNYVVFKFRNTAEGGPYYLSVPANSGESFFKDIYDSGNDGIETDPDNIIDTEGYLTWIEPEPFMEPEEDLLSDTGQLNQGIAGLEGTINLDF